MQVRKQQLELDMEQQTGLQIGKGVRQGCILSPCLLNLYAEYRMRNAGLDEAQAGIKIAGRSIKNLRYADDITHMAESEELKSLLMKVKRRVKKLACCCCCSVASVGSDSVQPRRRQPTRLLCPWDSSGKNTGVGCHFLLQCMHAC